MIATLEPVWSEAVQRRVFRALLNAQGFPGEAQDLSGLLNGNTATLAVLATLLDGSVTWADPERLIGEAGRRLLSAREVPVAEADFILGVGGHKPEAGLVPNRGELLSPEQAATVILFGMSVCADSGGLELELRGPGIPGVQRIRVNGFDSGWFEKHCEWNQAFPLGVDMVLTDRSRLVALPRTTRIAICRV